MIAQADAVRIPLPDQSVHCIMTSPPYYGLRKYSGEQGQEPLGLEATPERHIERIVEVGRELWRILRPDGVCFINYGDCYATTQNGRPAAEIENDDRTFRDKPFSTAQFAKAGSLMMMPHRVALALQADGWIVRQDLVWWKRNPMPESVNGWRWQRERKRISDDPRGNESDQQGRTLGQPPQRDHDGSEKFAQPEYEYSDDLELKRGSWRHTRAHEYVFMLTKKMQYWSNQEAVRESAQYGRANWSIQQFGEGDLEKGSGKDGGTVTPGDGTGGRNPRSVLDVPTAPYKGAHYATFPPNLIAPLIRATCPRRCCPVCGQGWAAVVDSASGGAIGAAWLDHSHDDERGGFKTESSDGYERGNVLGYRPTCEHPHTQEEAVPGTVFDPFVGSGTTVKVAQDLLRKGIGIDISMEYLDLQAKVRIGQGSPSNVLDDLPLFSGNDPAPPLNKQDSLGKSTYTGFNARWKDKHKQEKPPPG